MILKNTDIETLMNRIKGKIMKLICFGAGNQLKEACEMFNDFNFFNIIYKIVDNNSNCFTWQGETKKVFTSDNTFKIIRNDEVIIYISSSYYTEIYEQLDQDSNLSSIECYIHNFVRQMPLPYKFEECQTSTKPLIPKKIHYCWFGGKEIPKQNRIWMESWQKYCSGYEIIRWDENNYDITKNEYMHSAYKEKKYAFVSDYARLDIVHEQGGVYLDNDVELIKSIDGLLYNKCFLGVSFPGIIASGLGFGSIMKFPLLKAMRDYYNDCKFSSENKKLFVWNNGKHESRALSCYGLKQLNKPQYICEAVILPTDVLCPIDYLRNPTSFTPNTHAIHHFGSSWYSKNELNEQENNFQKCKAFWNKHFETCNN